MTRVNVGKNDESCFVSVTGHNSDTRICAMISALVAALEGYLKNRLGDGYFYTEGDGECRFTIPISAYEEVFMFAVGVMRIERTFPERVKTEVRL